VGALFPSQLRTYNRPVRRRILTLLVFVAAGLMTRALEAHHSIAGAYDSSNSVTIDGTISEFHFINPHPYLLVRVRADTGKVVEWRLEMDNRVELVEIGMTVRTLSPGERVIARGSRGRENAATMYVMRLDRPADGFWYEQIGSTPHIRK